MTRQFYAHRGEKDQLHLLSEHLKGTGRLAAGFLADSGYSDLAQASGLLHDLGKYTPEFQARLDGTGKRCDHSTAGAKVAITRYGLFGKLLAYGIAGHHAGLADGDGRGRISSLKERLSRNVAVPDAVWESEIELPEIDPRSFELKLGPAGPGFGFSFLIRMIFSALVDADYLDTEAWFASVENRSIARGGHPCLEELRERLDAYLSELTRNAKPGPINDLRRRVLEAARRRADRAPGVFTLTVPTGGGKTLTSLAFGLRHAVRHRMKRVIFVIPYTSIVEQTADVFRKALADNGRGFVLEHHGAFESEKIKSREARDKLRLDMENWDAPIVVTTAVQFFESLFANRTSRCRKLHRVANSVVVLDEAQSLPLRLLRPCVAVLDELARNWKTTVVLCTATQPALRQADGFSDGFKETVEIAPDPEALNRNSRRVRIRDGGTTDDSELAQRLLDEPQVLCIVNTRRHARELFESIRQGRGAVHLTTGMCAVHRRKCLAQVRRLLADRNPVRLVATSLVEAGVDLDFPVVWRAEAGLESIIQAAGRCNREGRAEFGDVYVFRPAESAGRKPPLDVARLADTARGVLRTHPDPMTLEAIREYFRKVYWVEGENLDAKRILRRLNERSGSLVFPFESVAADFRLIDDPMVPIIVTYDEKAYDLVRSLERAERAGGLARKLQPYTVSIPKSARVSLMDSGAVIPIRPEVFGDQFLLLENSDLYNQATGLNWSEPDFLRIEGLIH